MCKLPQDGIKNIFFQYKTETPSSENLTEICFIEWLCIFLTCLDKLILFTGLRIAYYSIVGSVTMTSRLYIGWLVGRSVGQSVLSVLNSLKAISSTPMLLSEHLLFEKDWFRLNHTGPEYYNLLQNLIQKKKEVTAFFSFLKRTISNVI